MADRATRFFPSGLLRRVHGVRHPQLNDPQPRVRLDSRLLTAGDVAELLRVPVSTVYELARSGRLPCLRIGRAVRFCQVDLEAHLSARRGTG
jgi:excisionase family DNA binding protein